jgi:hypothetical protein
MMPFSVHWIVAIAFASAPVVRGWAAIDTSIRCEPTFDKCAYRLLTGPSPIGGGIYEGGWNIYFNLTQGIADGDDIRNYEPDTQFDTNQTIHLSWDNDANANPPYFCTVKIDKVACNSCTVCSIDSSSQGGGTFSADCTNASPFGRSVTCDQALPLISVLVSK